MKVHNFFSDVLLSLSYFLNNVLNNEIKYFEYNIGNISFDLKFNPNYVLPSSYITYNNSDYFNIRPNSFHRVTNNINQIPVLHNLTKDLTLFLQEDFIKLQISVSINSDSQLQIINFKYILESIVPINKYLNFYNFTTFYELSEEYINPFIFDVNKDKIINLYIKHDKIIDKNIYCFSVKYEPLIKSTNINFNTLESTETVYSINIDFEILIQMPIKLIFDLSKDYSKIKKISFNNVKIPINGNYIELLLTNGNKVNCKYEVIDNVLISKHPDYLFEALVLKTIKVGLINGLIDTIYYDNQEIYIINDAYFLINDCVFNIDLLKDLEYKHLYNKYEIDKPIFKDIKHNIISYKMISSNDILSKLNLSKTNCEVEYVKPEINFNKNGIITVDSDEDEIELELVIIKQFINRSPNKIENINFNFNIVNELISPINTDINEEIKYVYDKLNIIKTKDKRYEFILENINLNNIKEYYFYFSFNNIKIDYNNLDLILDKHRNIFSSNESFYYNFLVKVNKLYPVFFWYKEKENDVIS